ncbi:MAG: hypothetical protein ACRELY_17110, partial [Polyangiaceae bacterium]
CWKSTPEATPEQATANYFAALATGDCKSIEATSGGDLAKRISSEGCAAAIAEANSHGLLFRSASGARPDGRDPSARLVDVFLKSDGKEKKIIARVARENGAWKVVTL